MKSNILLLKIACFAFILILSGCTPENGGCEEHDPITTFYKINETVKSKVLLSGTDTLVYISNFGDTAVLYGQEKKVFNETVYKKWDPDPGCSTYDNLVYEHVKYTYIGNNPDLNYIVFDINAGNYSPKQSNADITIGEISYTAYIEVLTNPLNYKDTLIINSEIYQCIKFFEGNEVEELFPVWYNNKNGFLKITTPNKVWLNNTL